MGKKVLSGLWLLLFYYCRSMPILAQCDNSLTPANDDLIKYQPRQNRCEGFYVAEVSGELEVVGFLKGNFSYELNPNEQIEIKSESVSEINIRAVGIPMTLYYRLDGKASQGSSLVWNVSDVLYGESIPSYNIGIYGWVQEGLKKVYFPVQTRTSSSQSQDDDIYRIYLRSPTALSDLRWRLCTNNDCSQYTEYSQGKIMAGQRIILEIPENLKGDCMLEIATMEHGMPDFEINKIYFRI